MGKKTYDVSELKMEEAPADRVKFVQEDMSPEEHARFLSFIYNNQTGRYRLGKASSSRNKDGTFSVELQLEPEPVTAKILSEQATVEVGGNQ